MIVLKRNGSLVLIRQVDHCALSGAFTRRWGNDRFQRPEPLEPVALASGMHDEGWREQDDLPLYDPQRRAPLHWRDVEVARHVVFYAEGIRRVAARDPYAGLLASMHGAGIYTRRYGTFPVKMSTLAGAERAVIDTFVAEQEAFQADLKRRVWNSRERRSVFERRLWWHYELMQIWDRLSLFVCLNDLSQPADDRLGPTPLGVDGPVVALVLSASGDRVVSIDPYPFNVEALDVAVPARTIPDRAYESSEDLQAEVRRASETPLRCRMVPASGRGAA